MKQFTAKLQVNDNFVDSRFEVNVIFFKETI